MNGSDAERRLRDGIVATARGMNAAGINRAKAGNVSARWREAGFDGFLVTPSAIPYERLRPEDVAAVSCDGVPRGGATPSTEWRFHRDIYAARADAHAIVHAHAPFCTTLACLGRGIPPFHYMVAVAGGRDIRCAPYATFGSQALADGVLAALDGRRACLMANHGMVALGASLGEALKIAAEIETLASQYWHACQLGAPHVLDAAELERVRARFREYGQGPRRRRP